MKNMIARLFRGITLLAICFAVGTLIAQTMIFAYVWKSWDMNDDKVAQMMVIARGKDLIAITRDELRRQEEIAPEQPSFEEIINARANNKRNLELREQALDQDVAQFRFEKNKQTAESTLFKETQSAFEQKLVELQDFQQSNGLQENIVMLQNMNPKQAKGQLLEIYKSGQIDQVVMLVSGMEAMKLEKNMTEFATPDENKILADILLRIRMGTPVALLAEQTLKELEGSQTTEN